MPLFGKSKTFSQDAVKILVESLNTLESASPKQKERAQQQVHQNLLDLKVILSDTPEHQSQPDLLAQLSHDAYTLNLFKKLVRQLPNIGFEGKKHVAAVFNASMRRHIGSREPTVEFMLHQNDILMSLIRGYEQNDIALTCGQMLRECVRHESLAAVILQSDEFYLFFDYVDSSQFDKASDAFSIFKDLLVRHKSLAAGFLKANYGKIFGRYEQLLLSENYVTKRQALKLLGELLLDRHNFSVMTQYISNPENLKLMMNMLREKSKNIQFEAFHVFKVFVANPSKPPGIEKLLILNKKKLIEFLTTFHQERTEDEQFNDEKTYLIKQIQELPDTLPSVEESPTEVGTSS